ncbi:GDSL esterase/lipase At2g23540-like [Impatiens glandulifera]|uniref:GDSL esterase/lipase At2g23540-like n=1 Tax=Impatiens glandulifera TaxID=253017 RepID=UPI001FB0767C|nr:GDSL esterase/lipase At2g23540-like [Impatiens glandulifera]
MKIFILALVFSFITCINCISRITDSHLNNGASFIFGDSLVDAGNNNYLRTLARGNIRPYSIDFKPSGGNPTGRYTNGKTIADITGELMGQKHYAVPFLAPNTTGKALIHGVNFASGGGGILRDTGRVFINRLSMDVQIDCFNITRQRIASLLGPERARNYIMTKSIFSVTLGSNDFLNNYLLPIFSVGVRRALTPEAFIEDLITHMRGQLTRLYNLDARKFIVANVGPIGCIPYEKAMNRVTDSECAELPNNMALQYGARLKDLLQELKQNLPEATFVYANVYDLVLGLIRNYEQYGFTSVDTPCCGGGQYSGLSPCGPTSILCADHTKHFFWDAYHPSEAANKIISKQLLHGDPKYVTPMTLQALRDL